MTTIRLSPDDLAALLTGKVIERVGGPSIKIVFERPIQPQNGDRELGTPAAEANGRSRSPGQGSTEGIDVVRVLVEEEPEDGSTPGFMMSEVAVQRQPAELRRESLS